MTTNLSGLDWNYDFYTEIKLKSLILAQIER